MVNSKLRFESLDGLRGLAAFSVLLDHTLACFPSLGQASEHPKKAFEFFTWLEASPLHLLWDGASAVLLFFLISGFSLAAWASRPNFSMLSYYPRRLARLYIPVFFAVLLGWAIIAMRLPSSEIDSLWGARSDGYGIQTALKDTTLLSLSGQIGPLWSMQWEVWFSLFLPVYILLAKKLNIWICTVFAFGSIELGLVVGNVWLIYMPMFLVGVGLHGLVTHTKTTKLRFYVFEKKIRPWGGACLLWRSLQLHSGGGLRCSLA